MNILVTGGSGFIGLNLVKSLISKGFTVHLLLRKDSKHPFGNSVSELRYENLSFFEMEKYFIQNQISGIIHLASNIVVSHNIENIKHLIDTNITLGTMLLEIGVKTKVKWFLNTGTFWQHFENSIYSPINLYAATKQAFQSISQFYINNGSIKFVTLKLNDTYGPNDTRKKMIPLWIESAKSGEVIDMTCGDQIIDIVHIDDIVDAYLALLFRMEEFISGSEFVVTSAKRVTLKELANIFQVSTNLDLRINWCSKTYRDRENMNPWNEGKIVPGWSPKISIQDGLKNLF